MEIRLEAAEGCKMPAGSFLAVKLGDVLKQGRYEPTRTYQFAEADKRRHAKIDLFKHVGSSVVLVSPDGGPNVSEVSIPSGDPLVENGLIRLKVDVKPHSSQEKRAEPVKQAVRTHAQTYLSKYGIEEKLSNCVKLLLQQQPDDPVEFICCQLRGTPYPPPDKSDTLASPRQVSASLPARAAGGDDQEGDDARTQARQILEKASQDGSLLKELQAVSPSGLKTGMKTGKTGNLIKELQASAAGPKAPEDPAVATKKALSRASIDGSLADALTEEDEEGVTAAVQRALVSASRDGKLLQALQALAPMPSSTAPAAGDSVQSLKLADGGYDIEGLRKGAAEMFVEATHDGRLQAVLAEMATEGA